MSDSDIKLYPEYEKIIGNYESVEEMCNDLALNYDDVFDYDSFDEEDDDD